MEQLKKVIGIGHKSTGNNYIINSCLIMLKKLGLLDYKYRTVKQDRQHERTQCYITWMTNEIQGLPEDLNDIKVEETYKKLKDKIA